MFFKFTSSGSTTACGSSPSLIPYNYFFTLVLMEYLPDAPTGVTIHHRYRFADRNYFRTITVTYIQYCPHTFVTIVTTGHQTCVNDCPLSQVIFTNNNVIKRLRLDAWLRGQLDGIVLLTHWHNTRTYISTHTGVCYNSVSSGCDGISVRMWYSQAEPSLLVVSCRAVSDPSCSSLLYYTNNKNNNNNNDNNLFARVS